MPSSIIDIGQLQLNNSIVPADGEGNYTADNGVIRSEFYEIGNQVIVERNGRRVSWTPQNMRYVDSEGTEDTLYTVTDVPLETKANYARYNRSMPDVDDWFIVDNDRLKHQILLQGFQRDPLPWLEGSIDFAFGGRLEFDSDLQIRANGLILTGPFETSGSIELLDADGHVIFTMPDVVAFDSRIPERASAGGKYRATENANGILAFDIVVANDWIASNERIYPIVIDPTTVVSAAYETSRNNGQRSVVALTNGWWIVGAYDNTNSILYFYKSTDVGATWSQLCTATVTSFYWAMDSEGTNVYVMYGNSSANAAYLIKFNAASVTNTLQTYFSVADSGQNNASSEAAIYVQSTSIIHAGLLCRNGTYASNNLRYFKSTDGGSTWAQTQVSNWNSGSISEQTASLVVNSSGNPTFVYSRSNGGGNPQYVICKYWNGTAWSSEIQLANSSTSYYYTGVGSLIKKYGSNIGRIWATWYGADAVDTTRTNIRVAYSDDYGATWSTMAKITSGNTVSRTNPTISENVNGDVYIFYVDGSGLSYQVCANGTTTFGSMTTLVAAGSTPTVSALAVSAVIGLAYKDSSVVKFEKLTFNVAPNAPTLTTKANFDATASAAFAWTFSDSDVGNTQSAYQLQIVDVSDGSVDVDTGKVASVSAAYSLAAATLANNKQYQWRVKTWDNSDAAGPYSSYSSFYTSAKPTTSITYPVTNGDTVVTSALTAAWSFSDPESEGQSAYQVRLTDDSDSELWSSGKVSGIATRSLTVVYTLLNSTNYKLKITTWDGKDVPSSEAVRTFVTSFTVPATPVITATKGDGYIGIAVTNPTPGVGEPAVASNDIYRRILGETTWLRVAHTIAGLGSYADYTVASGVTYEYYALAIGDNGTTSSSTVESQSITFLGVWLHDVLDPASTSRQYQLDGGGKNADYKPEMTLAQYAGRTRPVALFGVGSEGSIKAKLDLMRNGGDMQALRTLIARNPTVCYRDARGRKMFGVIPLLAETDERYDYSTTIEVIETSYSEVI